MRLKIAAPKIDPFANLCDVSIPLHTRKIANDEFGVRPVKTRPTQRTVFEVEFFGRAKLPLSREVGTRSDLAAPRELRPPNVRLRSRT
jgi:hypothetical protein